MQLVEVRRDLTGPRVQAARSLDAAPELHLRVVQELATLRDDRRTGQSDLAEPEVVRMGAEREGLCEVADRRDHHHAPVDDLVAERIGELIGVRRLDLREVIHRQGQLQLGDDRDRHLLPARLLVAGGVLVRHRHRLRRGVVHGERELYVAGLADEVLTGDAAAVDRVLDRHRERRLLLRRGHGEELLGAVEVAHAVHEVATLHGRSRVPEEVADIVGSRGVDDGDVAVPEHTQVVQEPDAVQGAVGVQRPDDGLVVDDLVGRGLLGRDVTGHAGECERRSEEDRET